MSRKPRRVAGAAPAAARGLDAWARGLVTAHLALSPVLFSNRMVDAFDQPKTMLLESTAAALLALGACAALRGGWGATRAALAPLRRDLVALGVLAGLGAAAVATFASVSPRTSLWGAAFSHAGLVTTAAHAIHFLAARLAFRTAAEWRRLLAAPLVGAAVAGGHALVRLAGQDALVWERVVRVGEYERPFGTLGNPLHFGAFLAMALPLALHHLGLARRLGSRAGMAGCGILAAACALLAAASLSRAAMLAALAAVAVLAFGSGRPTPWRALAAGAGLCGALLLLPPVRAVAVRAGGTLFEGSGAASLSGRGLMWSAAWEMFLERPLLGWGLDAFQLAYPRHRSLELWRLEWNVTPVKAHNDLLQVLATQGLPGALALLLLLAGLVRASRVGLARAGEERGLVSAALAVVVAFVVQDLAGFTVVAPALLALTAAAALARAAFDPEGMAPLGARDPLSVHALALGVALLAVAAVSRAAGAALAAPLLAGLATAALLVWLAARLETGAPPPSVAASAPVAGWRRWLQPLVVLAAVAAAAARVGPALEVSLAAREAKALLARGDAAAAAAALEARAPGAARVLDPLREGLWASLTSAHAEAARRPGLEAGERRRHHLRAIEAAREASALEPANANSLARLAYLQAEGVAEGLAEPGEALATYGRALDLDPKNVIFLADASRAALRLGEVARARAWAERAAELMPDFGPAWARLAAVARAEGRAGEAAALLEKASASSFFGERAEAGLVRLNLAGLRYASGRREEALEAARFAVAADPEREEPHRLVCRILQGLGREGTEADRCYQGEWVP